MHMDLHGKGDRMSRIQRIAIAASKFSFAAALTLALAAGAKASATTLENLQAAFNGESNANARYLAFAKQAQSEGYGEVASLFRAAARAEKIHATNHAAVIEELGALPQAQIDSPGCEIDARKSRGRRQGRDVRTRHNVSGFPQTSQGRSQLARSENLQSGQNRRSRTCQVVCGCPRQSRSPEGNERSDLLSCVLCAVTQQARQSSPSVLRASPQERLLKRWPDLDSAADGSSFACSSR